MRYLFLYMNIEKDLDNALYVEFRNFMRSGNYTFEENLQNKKRYIKLGSGNKEIDKSYTLQGWSLNNHHYNSKFFIKYIYPVLIKELLGVEFNINDFNLIEDIYQDKYDISYLVPKRNFHFQIWTHNLYTEGGYEIMRPNKVITKEVIQNCGNTKYHLQYIGEHSVSRIVNNDIENNYKLFVSMDSHMIPVIPVLACYFKEIIASDYRTPGKDYKPEYDKIYLNKDFTHILIAVSGSTGLDRFIKKNFDKKLAYWISNNYQETNEYKDIKEKVNKIMTSDMSKIEKIKQLLAV